MMTHGPLQGLIILQPTLHRDERGFFYEAFQQERYQNMGIPPFVQDNISYSVQNVIRGLHFQFPHPQGKLVYTIRGSIWDVVVDIRKTSATFGQWFGIHLNDSNHTQLYIPPGFAHGFCVLSDEASVHYKCTDYYCREAEKGIIWNDAGLNIPWPAEHPTVSEKDKMFPGLSAYE
jgi:dTDP-4-dehydrorhamnose 3,5-epimerase